MGEGRSRRHGAKAASALLCALLAACASGGRPPAPAPRPHSQTRPRPAPRPQSPAPRPLRPTPAPIPRPTPLPPPGLSVSDLPGWGAEDHLQLFNLWRDSCRAAASAAGRTVCDRARLSPVRDEAAARAFLQDNFRPVEVKGEGTLTAYFTPEYPARHAPDAAFSAPLRPRPPASALVVSTPAPAIVSQPLASRPPAESSSLDAVIASALPPPAVEPQSGPSAAAPAAPVPLPHVPTRAEIDAWPTDNVLAWLRPEDLFFMQIQGSGVLDFPGGERLRAITVATNGLPFVGIARPMRERGLLKDNATSGDAIRSWLAAHRGAEADEIMRLNTRYGFFALEPYDGTGVSGAAGLRLPAGRAVAVDRSRHPLGGLFWISADAPALNGAFPSYRRGVMALDIGGAIKGDVRADLYVGVGEAAGREAGRVRHRLRLFELEPRP